MEMGREMTLHQKNPCVHYKAALGSRLILAFRQRPLPTNLLSCGTQSAYISLINRRNSYSLPFPLLGG
jgi:hypothetical protein